MKKISILLILTLLFQTASGIFINAVSAEAVGYPVTYDFTNGTDGWNVRSGEKSSLSLETEDGNSFLRLKAFGGTNYKNSNTLGEIPSATVSFPDAFNLPSDSSAVISADIRTDNFAQLEKLMMINRQRIESDNVQYHLSTLWGWTAYNKVNLYQEQNNRKVDGYYRAKTYKCFEDSLENNKWYRFKTEIFTDESSKPSAIKLSVYDNDNLIYEGEKKDITNTSLSFSESITDIDIAMACSDVNLSEDIFLDIDNVSVTSSSTDKYWMISGGSVQRTENIIIRFSAAMDENLMQSNIRLLDADNTEIQYTGIYDSSTFSYTITPIEKLKSGEYTIYVDKNALGMADDAKDSESFTLFLSELPEVGECTAYGRIETGNQLTASAEYVQKDNISGKCNIQWQYCSSKDGNFENISGAEENTFTVTDEYENSYIRFVATPITDSGIVGVSKESNVLLPLLKPLAENVSISGIPMVGMEIAISYIFSDPNDDDEGKSIYAWYISENGTSGWKKLDNTSKYLMLDESMVGSYIRAEVTPVSTDVPSIGDTVRSVGVFGPVESSGSINMVVNGDFETGTTEGWSVRNLGSDHATLTATQEDAYSGQWCARFDGQTNASTFVKYSGVSLKADTAYIIRTAMKLTQDCKFDNVSLESYNTNENSAGTTDKLVSGSPINKNEWREVYIACYASKNAENVSIFPVYWPNGSGYSVYIDDMYVAPMVVQDIEVKTIDDIEIPVNGEKVIELESYYVKNQFGNTIGMDNEKVYWTVDENIPGVRVEGSKLYVSDMAVAGSIALKAVCEPSYPGAVQERFSKTISVNLIANSDKAPKIKTISLVGDTELNSILNLKYEFYQVDGLSDKSSVSWYVSDSENGEYKKIDDAEDLQLVITDELAGKFIKVSVNPIDSDGNTGAEVQSNICGPATAPKAMNVSVSGKTYYGQTLTGSYTFFDFNGDNEGKSKLKWYRSESENGKYVEIPEAVGTTYIIGDDDINCYLKFGVVPISQKEPNSDEVFFSEPIQGPFAPTAENLSIKKYGNILTGSYTYKSVNKSPEGKTKCEWYMNGKIVGTGVQYQIGSSDSGTVEFRVTPVAETKPYEGEHISVSYYITGNTGGTISGGGTSSKPSVSILPDLPSKEPNEDIKKESFSDITSDVEWAKEAIETLAQYNLINGKGEKIFAPKDNVTRAEFIKMLINVFNIETENAKCEFADVDENEWYYKFIAAATEKGIVNGYGDGRFGVSDFITRQDAAVMIDKILNITNNKPYENDKSASFADENDISDYAVSSVERLVNEGILNGSDGFIIPHGCCTRAQAAVIFYRLINLYGLKH